MALMLKANTAVDVLIGPFVDDSDGNTDETGLTITQADIRLSKNGQNMAQKNDANACTHDELGYYNCPLDATDTNTEGMLVISVHESGALPVRHEFNVLAEAAWDSLFAAKDTGYMDVNVKAYNEQTATTSAGNLPDVNVNEIEDAAALAGIEAECVDALESVQLDHLAGVTTGVAADGDLSTHVVDGSILSHLMTAGADTSDYQASTDSLEGFRNHVGDGTNLTEAGGDGDHLSAIPEVTANVTKINSTTLTGTGTSGDEWGPV